MDNTAPRPALGRRLVRGGAAVLAMVALGLGLAATPALAAPKGGGGGCAAATDSFNEADHFLNQAEGALGGMGAAC